jgi:hypothetical protein
MAGFAKVTNPFHQFLALPANKFLQKNRLFAIESRNNRRRC